MPKDRASALLPVMSSPSLIRRPAVACSNPARIIRNVVLPEPDGPSRVRNSPRPTSSDTFLSAWNVPKDFPMPIAWRPTARELTPFALHTKPMQVSVRRCSRQMKICAGWIKSDSRQCLAVGQTCQAIMQDAARLRSARAGFSQSEKASIAGLATRCWAVTRK